jgi:carbonic anhydrase
VCVPPPATNTDSLIARAKARAMRMTMAARPRRRTAILTCMDARIDPALLFGLKPGEAHVLRNAGARATPDVLRSLAVSQALLGTTEVLVLGHTKCGLHGRTENEVAQIVGQATGHRPNVPMGCFPDLDAAVQDSVEAIRSCEFLGHRESVRGYVLNIDEGFVRELGELPPAQKSVRASSSSILGLGALRADVLNFDRHIKRRP